MPKTQPGDTGLVKGPGQRGLASVIAAREGAAGTSSGTGLTRDAHKLALAREIGATHTNAVGQEPLVKRVRELTDGRGVDVVVEVTPVATQPIVDAIDCAALGGTVILAGVKGMKAVPNLISDKVVLKEITLRGAIGVTWDHYERAIRLIESRKLPLEKLQSRCFGLRDAERAVRTLAGEYPDEPAMHCVLVPEKS
jgi:threonine dehydrogenase-like Zn-dependent dehydrogenase